MCIWARVDFVYETMLHLNRIDESLIIRSQNCSIQFTWTRAQEQVAWVIAICLIEFCTIRFWLGFMHGFQSFVELAKRIAHAISIQFSRMESIDCS